MSQILAMAERLQDSERTISELKAALERMGASRDDDGPQLRRHNEDGGEGHDERRMLGIDSMHSTGADTEATWHHETDTSTNQSSTPKQHLLSDLSLDGNGKVCH